MLRNYVTQVPPTWRTYLPLAELAYNSSRHQSTNMTLFFLLYGRGPPNPMHAVISEIVDHSPAASSSLLTTLQDCWTDARDDLSYAQAQYAEFSPSDLVVLKDTLKKPPKLESLWSVPQKVLPKTSNVTYRLELKSHQRFDSVFYVGLLKPYLTGSNPHKDGVEGKAPDLHIPSPRFWTFLMNLFIHRNSPSFKSPRLFWKKDYPA